MYKKINDCVKNKHHATLFLKNKHIAYLLLLLLSFGVNDVFAQSQNNTTGASAASLSLITKDMDFVHELWNAKLEPYPDGYFDPYYDGLLYLFSLMHLSGKYHMIKPQSH